MDPQRYARAKELFAEARDLDPEPRRAFLTQACGEDLELLREVEELLDFDEQAADGVLGRVLDGSAAAVSGANGAPSEALGEGPGTELGQYRIVEVIGEGGFGTVYRARQSEPVKREVALKVIKLGMDTRSVVARFEAERQALALMDHPSIARVYDAGATEKGRPYFVMELVAGEPITTFCDREQLSTGERLALLRQVCLAVQHAHQKGVLHRDLKPSNILVTRVDGEPLAKVIDFGIAKAIEKPLTDSSLATEAFQVMGTPEYMSPEQASGKDVDTRADVYALGVVLYELLTGTRPFARTTAGFDDLSELLRQIHEETPPKPSTRASGLGPKLDDVAQQHRTPPGSYARSLRGDLDWIVMKSLEKDRERRYTTAVELADDLANHLAHRPVSAGRPSSIYRLRKFARRNRSLFAAGSVVALTLVLGVAALGWGYVVVRAERDAADRARVEEAAARAEAVRSQLEEAQARARADEERAAAELARSRESDERVRAEAALAQAKEVVEFLADSLAAARPERMGREVTMRAVLDEAAQRIEGRFDSRPRVEARLRFVMGESYLGLGLPGEAERHLELAARLYAEADGEDADTTFDARRELAMVYARQDRPDDALPLLNALIQQADQLEGQAKVQMFDLWNSVAVLFMERYENDEAARIWEQQIELAESEPGLLEERMIAVGNLAIAYEQAGRADEALELYYEALDYYMREFGPEHPETLNKLNNVTSALTSLGRYEEAEQRIIELIDVRVRVLGEEHPDTVGSVFNLALVYQRCGRLAEAAELTEGVLDIESRVLGETHSWTLATMSQLGVIYGEQGRLQEAEDLLRTASELAREHVGLEDPSTLNPIQNLADTLARLGRSAEAMELYEEILPIRRRVQGETARNTLALRQGMANLLNALGRVDEAVALLEQTLVTCLESDEDHPDVVASLRNTLASLYVVQERYAEGETLYRLALEANTEQFGETSPPALESRVGLVEVLAGLGRAEAEREFVERTVMLMRETARSGGVSAERLASCAGLLIHCEPRDLRDPRAALDMARRANRMADGKSLFVLRTLLEACEVCGEDEAALEARRALLALIPEGDPLRAQYEE